MCATIQELEFFVKIVPETQHVFYDCLLCDNRTDDSLILASR